MTESEAKEKWCPMVRRESNWTTVHDDLGPNCIGSACLMWRWIIGPSYQGEGQPVKTDFDGYCGLAGKP